MGIRVFRPVVPAWCRHLVAAFGRALANAFLALAHTEKALRDFRALAYIIAAVLLPTCPAFSSLPEAL